jgi:methylmalonyl-CoA/ethylmalonyl-CoA epimerase
MSASFRLHHVGHLVKDLAETAKRFVARFDYQIESAVIEDPVQTAYVQFLRLPNGRSWLELVMPNGRDSKLAGALARGGGLHHVCYEVDILAPACEGLRNDGMLLLGDPVPAVAFGGRPIAWLMDRTGTLVELLEDGPGPLRTHTLR